MTQWIIHGVLSNIMANIANRASHLPINATSCSSNFAGSCLPFVVCPLLESSRKGPRKSEETAKKCRLNAWWIPDNCLINGEYLPSRWSLFGVCWNISTGSHCWRSVLSVTQLNNSFCGLASRDEYSWNWFVERIGCGLKMNYSGLYNCEDWHRWRVSRSQNNSPLAWSFYYCCHYY